MATDPNITRIKFLRSKTANAKPLAADIDEGELAFNLTDRTIFSKSGTNVVELGFGKGGTVAGAINQTAGGITSKGTITAPTFSGALSGNATTATRLQTARTISLAGSATGSISFDGTSNQSISVNVNAVNALATYARSNGDSPTKWAQGIQSTFVSSTQGWPMSYGGVITARPHSNGGGTLQILTAYGSTSNVGNGEIKIRTGDYSGTGNDTWTSWKTLVHSENVNDYSPTKTGTGASGTWGIAVTGNAGSATVLQTARTIGGVSFNGSTNINLPGVNTAGNQSTTGNAATATRLQTARTIGGVSFNGSANINLPGVNIAGNQNTTGNAATSNGLNNIDAVGTTIAGLSTGTSAIYSKGRGIAFTDSPFSVAVKVFDIGPSGWQTQLVFDSYTNSAAIRSRVSSSGAFRAWDYLAYESSNVASATRLQTARTIGGVSFNGTANINLPGVNTAGNQSTSGNAATATVLQTARTINGTSFNGSANITTANWGTARTLTIGNTGKSVNGSANVSWSLAEIGAFPLSGGTATGVVSAPALGVNNNSATSGAGISLYNGSVASQPTYGIMFAGTPTFGRHGSVSSNWATYFTMAGDANRGWIFKHGTGTAGNVASISSAGVITALSFVGSLVGNAATATRLQTTRTINGVSFNGTANITIADSTKLPLAGGTMTGALRVNNTTASTSAKTGAITTTGGVGIGGALFTTGAITSANNITAYSDVRIKDNIIIIDDALNKVNKLKGVTYNRIDIDDKYKRYVGLIAQDVQSVMPEAVNVNNDDLNTLSVDYQGLVGLLVESIKELKLEIDELKEKVK